MYPLKTLHLYVGYYHDSMIVGKTITNRPSPKSPYINRWHGYHSQLWLVYAIASLTLPFKILLDFIFTQSFRHL